MKVRLLFFTLCITACLSACGGSAEGIPSSVVPTEAAPAEVTVPSTTPPPATAPHTEAETLAEQYALEFTWVDFAYEPLPRAELPTEGIYRQEEVLPGVVQSFAWLYGEENNAALYLTLGGVTYLLDDESIKPGDASLLSFSPLPCSSQVYSCKVGKGANYVTNLYMVIEEDVPLLLCQIDGPDPQMLQYGWDGNPAVVSTQSTVPFTTIYLVTPDKGYEYAAVNHQTGSAWVLFDNGLKTYNFYLGIEDTPGFSTGSLYYFDIKAKALVKEADRPELSAVPRPQGSLYFTLNNQFMGSWEDGRWRSINDVGGDYSLSERFLLADFLNQPGYVLYSRSGYMGYAQKVHLYMEEGLGGWFDGSRAHLLAPYAQGPSDWQYFDGYGLFNLPIALTGEAAQVDIPDYGYRPAFTHRPVDLATNSTSVADPLETTRWGGEAPAEVVDFARAQLRQNGNRGEPHLTDMAVYHFPGTGHQEGYFFFNSPRGSGGYPYTDREDGGTYSLVLFQNGEEPLEIIYEEYLPYTTDVTALFHVMPYGVFDLNGDGKPEVCVEHGEWEGGYSGVFSRDDRGAWKTVLRANWGS